jgi:hypothetical protein
MAEDKEKPFLSAQVRERVPGEETCDRDDDIVTIGGNNLEESLGARLHIAVHDDLALLMWNADGHGTGRLMPQENGCCLV